MKLESHIKALYKQGISSIGTPVRFLALFSISLGGFDGYCWSPTIARWLGSI